VWEFVSDINVPARFSEEFQGARWDEGFDGPAQGARFIGSNKHPAVGEWEVPCHVTRYEPQKEFGWSVVSAENPGGRWRFELSAIAGATRLRFHVGLGPGPSGITPAIEAMPDKEPKIIFRRLEEHRANMQRTLDGIKHLAETDGA
jgi:hypothetical protein